MAVLGETIRRVGEVVRPLAAAAIVTASGAAADTRIPLPARIYSSGMYQALTPEGVKLEDQAGKITSNGNNDNSNNADKLNPYIDKKASTRTGRLFQLSIKRTPYSRPEQAGLKRSAQRKINSR